MDTGKLPIQDIPVPSLNVPQVETAEVGEISSVNNTDNGTINQQYTVNSPEESTISFLPSVYTNTHPINQPTESPIVHSAKMKCLKLFLPSFRGDINEFRPFWESFENAVHKNTSLSKIDNLITSIPYWRAQHYWWSRD